MTASLSEWLKSLGINAQVDFGNLAVGVATLVVALVSLWVAFRSTQSSNNQKIAEFRQQWIDDVRLHVSQFIGTIYEVLNHSISSLASDRQRDLDTKHSELRRLETYVAMKLNGHEYDHRVLVQLMAQSRGRAAAFSMNSTSALANQIDDLINLTTDFSKLIFKTEWDRVRDDTYGRGRVSRALRAFARRIRRRNREAVVRNKATAFFEQIGISI